MYLSSTTSPDSKVCHWKWPETKQLYFYVCLRSHQIKVYQLIRVTTKFIVLGDNGRVRKYNLRNLIYDVSRYFSSLLAALFYPTHLIEAGRYR